MDMKLGLGFANDQSHAGHVTPPRTCQRTLVTSLSKKEPLYFRLIGVATGTGRIVVAIIGLRGFVKQRDVGTFEVD